MKRGRRNFLAVLSGITVMLPVTSFPTAGNVYEHLKGCWSFYETEELLNGKPLRKEDVQFRRGTSSSVLSDAGQDVMMLNGTATAIWELCDGKNSPETMVRVISDRYDVSPGACRNDVIITLRTFKRRGLVAC
jgi:hypothetical protein